MMCSWGVILWGLATVYAADGEPSLSLFLAIWGIYCLRREIPTRASRAGRWVLIAILSAVIIAAASILFLPEQILPFIFIPPLSLLFLYVVIAEVKQFRSPLRFFPPEDLARLKTEQ